MTGSPQVLKFLLPSQDILLIGILVETEILN